MDTLEAHCAEKDGLGGYVFAENLIFDMLMLGANGKCYGCRLCNHEVKIVSDPTRGKTRNFDTVIKIEIKPQD